jgi:hypothetical protein
MSKPKIKTIKEIKTLQVEIDTDAGVKTATFRFHDDAPIDAEVSLNGTDWAPVAVLHKAIGAFVDRFAFEFADPEEEHEKDA